MMCRIDYRPVLLATLFLTPAIALGQGSGPMPANISAAGPSGEPADFTFWRTGGGAAGHWTVVVDPTAANGRAIAQTSKDRTDYRFPLAVYKSLVGEGRSGRRHCGAAVDAW
jgi:hypothetical protein